MTGSPSELRVSSKQDKCIYSFGRDLGWPSFCAATITSQSLSFGGPERVKKKKMTSIATATVPQLLFPITDSHKLAPLSWDFGKWEKRGGEEVVTVQLYIVAANGGICKSCVTVAGKLIPISKKEGRWVKEKQPFLVALLPGTLEQSVKWSWAAKLMVRRCEASFASNQVDIIISK